MIKLNEKVPGKLGKGRQSLKPMPFLEVWEGLGGPGAQIAGDSF